MFPPPLIPLQDALAPDEITAANELTRRWLTGRADVPAAASGLGIWALLAALATGAVGDTRDELLAAAGLDLAQAAHVLGALIDATRSDPAISLALGAWAGPRIALDPEWVAGMPISAVGSLSGDADTDRAVLDAWANRNTGGLIKRMPIDLSLPIDLLLASALLVRTTWITPFEEVHAPFSSGPWAGRGQVLAGLYRDDVLRVGADAAVLTVRGGDDIDVLLGLGRVEAPPQQVVSALIDAAVEPRWGRPGSELSEAAPHLGVDFVEYADEHPQTAPETSALVPAFSLSSDLDLLEDAAVLGLESASDDRRARFDRIAAQALSVGQGRQACTAVFSATGFEAAAVTAFGMDWMGGPPPLTHQHVCVRATFDRPFAYLARHRPSGLVLVAGWVAEPAG
jgi:serine protease inhibitor